MEAIKKSQIIVARRVTQEHAHPEPYWACESALLASELVSMDAAHKITNDDTSAGSRTVSSKSQRMQDEDG
jgi:hypothetical protein